MLGAALWACEQGSRKYPQDCRYQPLQTVFSSLNFGKQTDLNRNVPPQRGSDCATEAAISSPETPTRQSAQNSIEISPEQISWYDKPGWLVLWCVLFYPIGFYGLVRSRTVKQVWKIAIFLLFGFYMIFVLSTG